MKAQRPVQRRRVARRYSAAEREQLIQEQAQSGQTKKAFCQDRALSLHTFYGWAKKRQGVKRALAFAEVQVAAPAQADVELLLPNGIRVGLRHQGTRGDLAGLIREVAGC